MAGGITCVCRIMSSPKMAVGVEKLRMAIAQSQMTPGQRAYFAWHTKMGHENIAEWHSLKEPERQAWEMSVRAAMAPLLTESTAHAIDELNKLLGQLLR